MNVRRASRFRGMRVNITVTRYLRAFTSARGGFATIVIVLLTVASVSASIIFPEGYDVQGPISLQPPSLSEPFGTDEYGRSLLARSLFGLKTDLLLVYCAVPIALTIGTLLGLIGFVSSVGGAIVQRILDIILGFPGLVLAMSVVLILGPGFVSLLISLVIIGLPTFGRLSRGSLLAQQQREYVVAALALGLGRGRIMIRHLLPNTIDTVLVQGAVFVVQVIFLEAGMSVLGLGIQPPEPSLGSLLNSGMRYITTSPSYMLGPILLLLLLALAFSMLSDALNETVNRE